MAKRDGTKNSSHQTWEKPGPRNGDETDVWFRSRHLADLRPRFAYPPRPKPPRVADVEDLPAEPLSPFYNLLAGATRATLVFPADEDSIGPFWNERGELDVKRGPDWSEEDVAVVPLGEKRYRLAVRMMGPFSALKLHWGDEFMAEPTGGDELTLRSVIMPQRFAHFCFPVGGFGNLHPLAEHLHAMGGGWELVAEGMLTLTVPAERSPEFEHLMHEQGLAPGVIAMEV